MSISDTKRLKCRFCLLQSEPSGFWGRSAFVNLFLLSASILYHPKDYSYFCPIIPVTIMDEKVLEKLKVLAESAKYDVSCASSGTSRKNQSGGIGSAAGWGICHSFAEDGRCISLLKIMLTNYCMVRLCLLHQSPQQRYSPRHIDGDGTGEPHNRVLPP